MRRAVVVGAGLPGWRRRTRCGAQAIEVAVPEAQRLKATSVPRLAPTERQEFNSGFRSPGGLSETRIEPSVGREPDQCRPESLLTNFPKRELRPVRLSKRSAKDNAP
jgi:hypothetical protein